MYLCLFSLIVDLSVHVPCSVCVCVCARENVRVYIMFSCVF